KRRPQLRSLDRTHPPQGHRGDGGIGSGRGIRRQSAVEELVSPRREIASGGRKPPGAMNVQTPRGRGPMLEVLFEDNHCLAVVNSARVLTAGDQTGDVSLLAMAREYLKYKYHKPGNVFVGLVHRLDRPVSGVVLFARTSKAASRLSEQFREGTVRKVYR